MTSDELTDEFEKAIQKAIDGVRSKFETSKMFSERDDYEVLDAALDSIREGVKMRIGELSNEFVQDRYDEVDEEIVRMAEADADEKGGDIDDIRPSDRFLD